MKSPVNLHLSRGSARTYLLAIIAVSAIVATTTLVLRSGPEPAPVAADSLNAPASGAFIKIGDIKGESKDSAHKDWINLLSVSHGITRPGGGATGSTRQRASATFGDVVVVKELDKSSPKLQEAIANGQVFPKLELELTSPSGGSQSEPYIKWELTNVQISGYRLNGASAGTERPTETFSLNYEEIKVTYTEFDDTGRKGGNVEYSWKVEEGTN